MRGFKKKLLFLLLSIVSGLLLGGLVYFYPPDAVFSFSFIQISYLSIFFFLLALWLFATGTFVFKSKFHGLFITLFVVIYLIFRLNNLTHPFFLILLSALFLTLELFISHRK
ncbi:MAG: hypothetical protein H0W89_01510 [Candidatus Levybacteria bacterium]|nr:hypothetical protein [Candidatus Levybacteria bacterium]